MTASPPKLGNIQGRLEASARHILLSSHAGLIHLRGNLLHTQTKKLPQSLLVTSARREEGKTTTAIAIAYGLAQQSRSEVLLVSANDQSSPLSSLFHLSNESGFGDYLMGDDTVQPQSSEFDGLQVLPWGPQKSTLWHLLDPQLIAQRFQRLASRFEILVIDGPSVLHAPETLQIHGFVEASLLVVQSEATKWQVAQVALERLNAGGGSVIGTVMNKRKYYAPGLFYGKI